MNSSFSTSSEVLNGVDIRKATINDLPALVQIHKVAYSQNNFTSLLPDRVLAKYYEIFLTNGSEICLALTDNTILGFAVYGKKVPERITAFKKAAARDILMTALRHPVMGGRKLLSAIASRLAAGHLLAPAEFLLLSIAVIRPRRGIGARLLRQLTLVAEQQGESVVGLYVNADNTNAINAYFFAGFVMKQYQCGQFYMEKHLEK
jgi:ribosomal protein S18 acetylase RimI-like enzyme